MFEEKWVDEIKFSSPREAFGQLSNFWCTPDHAFVLDGYKWKSNEHFYQAQKFAAGSEPYMAILEAETPRHAKDIGRSKTFPIRFDWDAVKESVMYRGLKAKFSQNPDLRKLLVGTGDRALVEVSSTDRYWGRVQGQGENRLGVLLMALRDELRNVNEQ